MALKVSVDSASAWDVRVVSGTGSGARRGAVVAAEFPPEFLAAETTVDKVLEIAPRAGIRRAPASPSLELTVETTDAERALVAVRHASGALTFHVPEIAAPRRGRRGGAAQLRFRIPLRPSPAATARRGLVTKAVKVIVLKVAGAIADAVLPRLVLAAEAAWWKRRRLSEGWHAVAPATLSAGTLAAGGPQSGERSLLLLHGTFSDGARAFGSLATSAFFQRVAPLYDGRIFAFNHFSLSKTPAENAAELLRALPDRPHPFDVITHSRGGLVLRELIEADRGALSRRLTLGRAVLVAAPNEGTPLVTPQRWEQTVGWLANLLELFPENPWTTAAGFVADGIVWLANRASGSIPGLGAMDAASPELAALQGPPGPPQGCYSALVANYQADETLLTMALDVGVDAFFATANDLVVPTEGGWRTGGEPADYVPAERIGSFGPGGNLLLGEPQAVTHMNFFTRPETVDFLVRALKGEPQGLAPIETVRADLPVRRAVAKGDESLAEISAVLPAAAATPAAALPPAPASLDVFDGPRETMHIMILPEHERQNDAQLLAMFGSARVLERFPLRGETDGAGARMHEIIKQKERILNYIEGAPKSSLPSDAELIEFGKVLFETCFPGDARRLYDVAREKTRGGRLDLIFTSMIPWVADKPWEFAYDPSRKTFLATEEIHFIRNVLTAVPAQTLEQHVGPLRILVVVAQPVGAGNLSSDEEVAVIRRGFDALIAAGLAEVEVLPRATPASLHAAISTRRPPFDVVHFIGHGEFDAQQQRGFLLFEDETGGQHRVNDRTIREILCQRGVRLIFLNACETGRGGQADFNSGVAPALVAGGVPVVVANQFAVLDVSATSFARHFYWSLASGMSVGAAAREARIAVNYSIAGEAIDWAVPVVYARDPSAAFTRPAQAVPVVPPQTAAAAGLTRRGRQSVVRVGLWDVQQALPGLRATLQQLNQSQSVFQFELVELSAPIGTWKRHPVSGNDRLAFLQAEEVCERLAPAVQQLGLDALACITTFPMADSERIYIYGYAPDGGQPPIMLFSTSDLDIPPRGELRDCMVANLLVSGLVWLRADMPAHEQPPRDCPLFDNPERDVAVIVGRQSFDAKCLRQLKAKLPAREIDALQTLLTVFGHHLGGQPIEPGANGRPPRKKAKRKRKPAAKK